MNVNEAAVLVGGTVEGDGTAVLTGVAAIEEAQSGDLVFAETERFLQAALVSSAAAVLTANRPAENPSAKTLIHVPDPRAAFVRVLESLEPPLNAPPGIHPRAHIGKDVRMGADASIGPHVTVGDGTTLGDRVVLLPGVQIGEDCVLGDDTILFPNVVLYSRVVVGKRCRLHAGCVIGADGFGYIPVGRALRKVPQLGTVEIGDDVEIGANSCIDRAKTSKTVIGSGTKLDNLVQVGHNVRVGQACILVAQVGIAGGATLGNGVILAGQAGVNPHVTIGDGARVGGRGVVIGNVPAGADVSGYPARPHAAKMREYAAVAKLPEYIKRIRALEKRLAALEAAGNRSAESAGEEEEE